MSPRTKKQFHEIREEKRSLIMDAALERFANYGYHITTISQIAKHAGISKGLMYNYFDSKETLLREIVNRSVREIIDYMDPDKDGNLSDIEFEQFVRRLFHVLREKVSFWRLFYQLIMQKEVRSQVVKQAGGSADDMDQKNGGDNDDFIIKVNRLLSDYFNRKKSEKPNGYDPVIEMNMFIYTIEGFAMAAVFSDKINNEYYNKTIERILELYK